MINALGADELSNRGFDQTGVSHCQREQEFQ